MKHGEGFVDSPSKRDRISKVRKLEGKSRRWSAVSQRVPRDAHQRFVKTDVLGKRHHILGEEMSCWPPGLRISEVRERMSKKTAAARRAIRRKSAEEPRGEPAKAPCREAASR
jgi:hypothetical protein